MKITPKTVESHRKHIMTKLGLRARSEWVDFTLHHQLAGANRNGVIFEPCPRCEAHWHLRGEFRSDPKVQFIGYPSTAAYCAPGRKITNLTCKMQNPGFSLIADWVVIL